MTRFDLCWVPVAMALAACDVVQPVQTATTEQAGMNLQGMNLQGMNLQGMNLQGMNLQGINLDGATLSGDDLESVRVSRGELVAKRNGMTVRGTALIGAHLSGVAQNVAVNPPTTQVIEYRITDIEPEDDRYDPTDTGHTYVYTLEQFVEDTGTWEPACSDDADGRAVAIPVAAIWNAHGDRVESDTMFTFGCTTGVIAKCYRWGYRPWVNGYGDLVAMHQTCTRMARADYCGIGRSHTHDGTKINVWDRIPSPGPIQRHGGGILQLPPPGMWFEAGWNTGGAVCMSTARWLLADGIDLAQLCPDRLVPPGLLLSTVCDTVTQVLLFDPNARMFNESNIINH